MRVVIRYVQQCSTMIQYGYVIRAIRLKDWADLYHKITSSTTTP